VKLPPFQHLLDAHGRDVHRFLVAILGPRDADDCYQETWIAVLRAYPRLRDDSNLRGWVLTIAHRKALDDLRARRRRAVAVGQVADGALGADAPPALPPDADDGLWSRVRELPTKQRTALALRFLADSGYNEIATVMGTTEEAARRNVHEGLKRLRKEYDRDQ
jgi:RNA polymerase sigma factor (sigma-70 family)